jgi:hypothetical protein
MTIAITCFIQRQKFIFLYILKIEFCIYYHTMAPTNTPAVAARLEPLALAVPEPPSALDALPDNSYYLCGGVEYGRYYQVHRDGCAVRYYAIRTTETKQSKKARKPKKP